MKKHFPTYIHESCLKFGCIDVSAGLRGLQIKINPNDLIREIKAETAFLITTHIEGESDGM